MSDPDQEIEATFPDALAELIRIFRDRKKASLEDIREALDDAAAMIDEETSDNGGEAA